MTTGSPQGGTASVNQMSLGAALPLSVWHACVPGVRIVWQARWAPAGLMPVRPVVALVAAVTIPPKKALKLWTD